LFVLEQLKLDSTSVNVYFLGDIFKESEFYKIAYTYIKNIQLLEVKNSFFDGNNEFGNHTNYILLG